VKVLSPIIIKMKCKNTKCENELKGRQVKYCSRKCWGIDNSSKGAIAKHKKYSQEGKKNSNWKKGISKNNYHYKKIQKERYPERIKAREIVHKALKTRKLVRPNYCSKCGCQQERKDIVAHHEDYNQPLKVVWLCKKCHHELHE